MACSISSEYSLKYYRLYEKESFPRQESRTTEQSRAHFTACYCNLPDWVCHGSDNTTVRAMTLERSEIKLLPQTINYVEYGHPNVPFPWPVLQREQYQSNHFMISKGAPPPLLCVMILNLYFRLLRRCHQLYRHALDDKYKTSTQRQEISCSYVFLMWNLGSIARDSLRAIRIMTANIPHLTSEECSETSFLS